MGLRRKERLPNEQAAQTPTKANPGQESEGQTGETHKGKGKVKKTPITKEDQRRVEKENVFNKEKETAQKINLQSQATIVDTGQVQIITGMLKTRITAIRHQMPEKVIIGDIKVNRGITGIKEGNGRRDRKMRHRLRGRIH